MASEARAEVGIGRYLAAQRRLRGVTLEELAQLTKIPFRSLERLESGAFDSATDGFVRGFVRTVAEALGLDPDEAVMRMLEEPRPDAEVPERAPILADRRALLAQLIVLTGVALLAVLVWQLAAFWMSRSDEPEAREVLMRRDPVRELAAEARLAPPPPLAEVRGRTADAVDPMPTAPVDIRPARAEVPAEVRPEPDRIPAEVRREPDVIPAETRPEPPAAIELGAVPDTVAPPPAANADPIEAPAPAAPMPQVPAPPPAANGDPVEAPTAAAEAPEARAAEPEVPALP